MDFTIEKIDKNNYGLFEDLTFIRKNGNDAVFMEKEW